jgi:probable addiction module antidote protein
MSVKTAPWDASRYLTSPEDITANLNVTIDDGDPALLQVALGNIAKAQGMTQIDRAAGVGRESLYKSLSADGTPSLKTVLKVLRALGIRMVFETDSQANAPLPAEPELLGA